MSEPKASVTERKIRVVVACQATALLERDPPALAAAQSRDRLENVVAGKEESRQEIARLGDWQTTITSMVSIGARTN